MATFEVTSAVASVSQALLTEAFTVDVTVKNTKSSTVSNAYLLFTLGCSSQTMQRLVFSVGGRKSKTVTVTFDGLSYPQAWATAMASQRRTNLLVQACDNNGSISEAYAVEGFEILDAYYKPTIETFVVKRTGDEADTVKATIKLSHADGLTETQLNRMSVTLSAWDYNSEYRDITVNKTLAELIAGITDDTTAITDTFATGTDYRLTLHFGDYSESAAPGIDEVEHAFVNLNLSGCDTGGACFGGYCKSTKDNPMLESHYPIYAYQGIANFQFGETAVATLKQKYVEQSVVFGTPFREETTPVVMICMSKSAEDTDRYIALLSAFVVKESVTNIGFTVRVCSNSSNSYDINIRWMAYGLLAT